MQMITIKIAFKDHLVHCWKFEKFFFKQFFFLPFKQIKNEEGSAVNVLFWYILFKASQPATTYSMSSIYRHWGILALGSLQFHAQAVTSMLVHFHLLWSTCSFFPHSLIAFVSCCISTIRTKSCSHYFPFLTSGLCFKLLID